MHAGVILAGTVAALIHCKSRSGGTTNAAV